MYYNIKLSYLYSLCLNTAACKHMNLLMLQLTYIPDYCVNIVFVIHMYFSTHDCNHIFRCVCVAFTSLKYLLACEESA